MHSAFYGRPKKLMMIRGPGGAYHNVYSGGGISTINGGSCRSETRIHGHINDLYRTQAPKRPAAKIGGPECGAKTALLQRMKAAGLGAIRYRGPVQTADGQTRHYLTGVGSDGGRSSRYYVCD